MKFFIDTANLEQIRLAESFGILDGVTTNPSLMAKEGIKGVENIYNHYRTICEMVKGPVSAEVIATDFETMVEEGEKLASLHPNIVVKVPMTRDGIRAIHHFSKKNIATNCTLIFSPAQAILAAKAGATYLSPFVGRVDDNSDDGIALISKIVDIYNAQGYQTQILAASIRHPMHVVQCAELGADVVTCPFNVINQLFDHPMTTLGLERFLEDYRKSQL